MLFQSLSNALQWSGIYQALDPFEDYTQLVDPAALGDGGL